MKKCEEISNPHSCLNKAKDDEIIFVLLERDEASPNTIRKWVRERIRLGLNKPDDPQLCRAIDIALLMDGSQLARKKTEASPDAS